MSDRAAPGAPASMELASLLRDARNDVRLLPATRAQVEVVTAALGPAATPWLRAVAEVGGLLIDHGWLRVLGADTDAAAGLRRWNGSDVDARGDRLVVGHDVVGGFFAVRTLHGQHVGPVEYLAPDTLTWEAMGVGYGDFLGWALGGDLGDFYRSFRWEGWEAECRAVGPDHGFSIYPFPWASEGGPIGTRSRRVVPMSELWELQHDLALQLAALPDGATIEVRTSDISACDRSGPISAT